MSSFIGSYILCGVVTLYFLGEIVNLCFLWVNDKEFKTLVRKFAPWIFENSSLKEGDWISWPLLLYACAFVLGIIWPLALFLLVCGGMLCILRWVCRLKRSLTKAGIEIDLGKKGKGE